MPRLSLSLLGPFTATYQDQPLLKFRSSNAQALLIYLAVEHKLGTAVSPRQVLMELFWPGSLLKSAQANLRQTLYQLRQAIPHIDEQPFLLTDRSSVQINPDIDFELDVAIFLQQAKGNEIGGLETAVSVYRGSFLEDFHLPGSNPFTQWSGSWAERCHRTMLESLQTLAADALQHEQWETAVTYARQQIELDSLHEPGHQQLITALGHNQRSHEAVTHFESYARLLRHELDLPPSAEMLSLMKALRSGELEVEEETAVSPPQKPKPAISISIPNNLYPPATPFVGRTRELNELDDWLSSPAVRLINIVGPGGIGKTRLAVMIARHQLNARLDDHSQQPRFPDGVYFVSLAPLRKDEDIIPAIIKAIDLKLERAQQTSQPREVGQSVQTQLLNHLRDKRMLLVMNNYEHLLSGTRILVDMLRAAPAMHILVTSRERLQLHGEQVFPLQGLDFPAEDEMPQDAEPWQAYSAVQLFLQSARRIRPDFELSDDDWLSVGNICQWVEGLPLGLELAASWIDVMSPADIIAELRNSLDILETELRDMPPRHRSMRAVFDYTWQRLSPAEQTTLPALSVLEDGFSRAAAQQIAGASLRLLANLVNKSLLRYSKAQDQFEMHALVRQYAADKLAEDSVRETAVKDKHAAYYCHWLQKQRDTLKSAAQHAALSAIDIAADNIQVAWDWAVMRQQWALLAAALESYAYFYWWRGRLHRGLAACKQIVTAITHQQPISDWIANTQAEQDTKLLLGSALTWQGLFSQLTGQMHIAPNLLQNSATILDGLEKNPKVQAVHAFNLLQTGYYLSIRDHVEASKAFKHSLQLYESLGDRSGQSAALQALGRTQGRLGDFTQSQQWLARSRDILHELGDQRGVADVASIMCRNAIFTGQIDEAVALSEESVSIVESMGLRIELKKGLLAFALQLRGDIAEGAAMQQKALESELRLGATFSLLYVRTAMGHLLNGDYALAHEQATGAFELANKEGRIRVQPMAKQVLGMAAMVNNDVDAALAYLNDGADILYQLGEVAEASWLQGTYADVLWLVGEKDAAKQSLQQAMETAVSIHSYLSLLFILPPLMRFKLEQGEIEHATRIYHRLWQEPMLAKSPWFRNVYGCIMQPHLSKTIQSTLPETTKTNLWDFAPAF